MYYCCWLLWVVGMKAMNIDVMHNRKTFRYLEREIVTAFKDATESGPGLTRGGITTTSVRSVMHTVTVGTTGTMDTNPNPWEVGNNQEERTI